MHLGFADARFKAVSTSYIFLLMKSMSPELGASINRVLLVVLLFYDNEEDKSSYKQTIAAP